jgi:hypothetical protein
MLEILAGSTIMLIGILIGYALGENKNSKAVYYEDRNVTPIRKEDS